MRRGYHPGRSWAISLTVPLALGATSLPLPASTASTVIAIPKIMPAIGTQLAVLKGSDTVASDYFGDAVATSGNTIVVGASHHAEDAGRAYVFTDTTSAWRQTAELKGSDTVSYNGFGTSVAVSGTTIVVGAPYFDRSAGRVYIFTKMAGGWEQTAELKGSDTVANDTFGASVGISGSTVVIGAPGEAGADTSNGYHAYVFTKSMAGWAQTGELEGTAMAQLFGDSVAISGPNILVGIAGASIADWAYVFTKSASGWRRAELKGAGVSDVDGFGFRVAVSGTTAMVSAPGASGGSGRVYVFVESADGWRQTARMKGSDIVDYDQFGSGLAMWGNSAVVSSRPDRNSPGRAYVFAKTATGWKQTAEIGGSHTLVADDFGASVAISGTTALVGASGYHKDAGRVYVFEA